MKNKKINKDQIVLTELNKALRSIMRKTKVKTWDDLTLIHGVVFETVVMGATQHLNHKEMLRVCKLIIKEAK